LLAHLRLVFELSGNGRDSAEKSRAFLEKCNGSADGVLKVAEAVRPSYGLLAKKLDVPLDEFQKVFECVESKQAGNPVFKLCLSALDRMRWLQARAGVRRAMLSAALAVQLDGRDALKDYSDPVVGGPFVYVAFEGGFELRSKWNLDDKLRAKWKLDKQSFPPVTLSIGRRGKS
jgi:hypothetical protein